MKGAEPLRDQTGSGHSSSQTLSPSLEVCAQLCPSQAPPLTTLEASATVEGGRQKRGWITESQRGDWGFQWVPSLSSSLSTCYPAGPGTLRVHQHLRVGCWSACMQNHTLAWRCSCILHPPGLPGGKRQCVWGSIFPLTQEKAKQKLPHGGAESAS